MQSHEPGFFLTKIKIKYKIANKWRTLICKYTKFDFAVDERKERLSPSREKNEGKHRIRKLEKSCVAFLLCDPGWYVHKPDVQNRWNDNTHTRARAFDQRFS